MGGLVLERVRLLARGWKIGRGGLGSVLILGAGRRRGTFLFFFFFLRWFGGVVWVGVGRMVAAVVVGISPL